MTDGELLRQFVREKSHDAFSQIVQRHKDWLYSVCVRRLGDRSLAEDAVQVIFQVLSRKAAKLVDVPTLSPWLHQAAKYTANTLHRSQVRRWHHEKEAAVMSLNQIPESRDEQWNKIESDLEPALDRLGNRDRQVILLRFYEQQSHTQIATALSISEEASQKRLSRALDRLRTVLTRGSATLPAAAIGGLLLAHAVQPAPAALAGMCSASISSLPPRALAASKAIGHGMTLAQLKSIAVATVLLLAIPAAAAVIHFYNARSAAISQMQTAGITNAAQNFPPIASADTQAPASTTSSTTAPSTIDLTTPEKAARSFFTALKNGDHDTAYACLTADPNRPANLMDAMLAWNLAQNHLTNAITQSFGGDTSPAKQIITLDQIAFAISQRPNGTSNAAMDGDTATLSILIPPWIITIAPAGYQPILRNWSDKKLYFHKQADQWKFDIDRSMQVKATIRDRKGRPLEAAAAVAIITENAHVTDRIAVEVDDGQITSMGGVVTALHSAVSRIAEAYGYSFARFDVVPGN